SLVRALERGDEEPRERVAVRDDERDLLERRAVDGRLLDHPADGGVDLLLDARVLLERDGAVGAGGAGAVGAGQLLGRGEDEAADEVELGAWFFVVPGRVLGRRAEGFGDVLAQAPGQLALGTPFEERDSAGPERRDEAQEGR